MTAETQKVEDLSGLVPKPQKKEDPKKAPTNEPTSTTPRVVLIPVGRPLSLPKLPDVEMPEPYKD
jgi:hypothetical protein